MNQNLVVEPVRSRRDLRRFVLLPWRIYRHDPNWVPPLIGERMAYLTPSRNPFLHDAEMDLFLARRAGRVVGSIGVILDAQGRSEGVARFGFFEVEEDYAAAAALLDRARRWAKEHGASWLRGPANFSEWECPGVLVEGTDCPPVMLAAHTPLYYREFLERYGMASYQDMFAWRAFREQIGEGLEHVPDILAHVAQVAEQHHVVVRKLRFDHWTEDVDTACYLFNATLQHLPKFVPISQEDFRHFAEQVRPLLDPDLALFAEVDGKVVGFCVSWPDFNRVLIHLNGRLWPLGWVKLFWYMRRIDVLTFKLMGLLPEYRLRGIDALLFLSSLRAMMAKGYRWLDGSLTSEYNAAVNQLAARFGAERYKHYRLYQMAV